MNLQLNWSNTLDNIEKIFTILAIILGGVGAYLKFFKGRTYHNRLQLEVSGRVVIDGEVTCLLVTMQLKNVGVSSVYLDAEGTRIDVYSYAPESYQPMPHLAIWQTLKTFPIFQNCEWIESGEAAKDELLIRIADQRQVAFKIDMTVNSRGISFRSRAIVKWKDGESNLLGKEQDHELHA